MRFFKIKNLIFQVLFTTFVSALNAQNNKLSDYILKFDAPVKSAVFNLKGDLIATGGENKTINIWDSKTGEPKKAINLPCSVKAIEFIADDNMLVACGDKIILLDREGKTIRTFGGYTTDVWSFSYCKPINRIVAGSYSKTIKIWDFNSGKILLSLEGHEKSCLAVSFDPAGKNIVSGSLDKSVRIWDANSGKQTAKLDLHSENIFAVDFHPSGKYFATASGDKTIRLWKLDSAKIIRTFVGHKASVLDVQFSPDGNHILSCDADKVVILWETATGKNLHVFTDHAGAINSVRISPDVSAFITASDDKTARYWVLDKKYFLEGSYFEKEIERSISDSKLFLPRSDTESKQDFQSREASANAYLDELYNTYYEKYIEVLNKRSIE